MLLSLIEMLFAVKFMKYELHNLTIYFTFKYPRERQNQRSNDHDPV